MTHKTQVNIRIPDVESLYCINCKVNPADTRDPLVKSLFHSQILTCRLIIYTMRCCIASPSIQNVDDLIHVIVNKSFYDSGKFHEHFSKLKVHYTNPEPVHPKIYEACLKYTFTFRLAPHWNSIGKSYYLQGFNFLSLTSNINAIEWNILFNKNDDIKLELTPMKMNLFPLTLDSLSLPPKTVDGFILNDNITCIDLSSFNSPWVYVLPKLTRAKIVLVSKTLPESCPFENYNDLRRHWKNMYSYRLPKSEQGLLFYEVVFPSQPNQYFTYPEICILSKMPELLVCDNRNELAMQFLKDLSTNVHSVCGDAIQICQLYPPLNIEYSCVLRNTINFSENQYSQQQNLYETPTESNNKLVNEKLNLSALFTYKGMASNTQNYKQKVLSIMQNNKRKKILEIEDGNLNPTQSMFTNKKRKIDMSQRYLPSIPEIKQQKTIITNTDDILSYYDIPSMYPDNEEFEQSDHDTHFREYREEAPNAITKSRPQPVIKSVEDVCFNLNNDNSVTNSSEKIEIKTNSIKEDKNGSDPSNSKLLKSVEERDIPRNLNFDTSKEELPKSLHFDESRIYNELQSSIHSIDLNSKILSTLLPKENTDLTFDSTETQSYDKKIRSFLSSFDLYNIHGQDDINIKKEYAELHKELDGIDGKSCEYFRSNTPSEKSGCIKNHQSILQNDTSPNKNRARSQQSLVDPKKGTDVCQAYSRDISENCIMNHPESQKDATFRKDCTINYKQEFSRHSVSETIAANTKRVLHNKTNKQKLFDTPTSSALSRNNSEEANNRELLQNRESVIDEEYGKTKTTDLNYQEFGRNHRTGIGEKSCKELNDSSIRCDNVRDLCRTPTTDSIYESINSSQVLKNFNNTPQYSTDGIPSNIERQNENLMEYNSDLNDFAGKSDFLSILSESSNDSDTGDYESCKLVFNEALTLNK